MCVALCNGRYTQFHLFNQDIMYKVILFKCVFLFNILLWNIDVEGETKVS